MERIERLLSKSWNPLPAPNGVSWGQDGSPPQQQNAYNQGMRNDKAIPVILDDASLTEAQRNDLRAFLASQNEVTSFGAFIPRLEASTGGIASELAGALTTVYVLTSAGAKGSAVEILRNLVGKWLERRLLPETEKSPTEYVIILDQYGRPVVKVEVPTTPKGKH